MYLCGCRVWTSKHYDEKLTQREGQRAADEVQVWRAGILRAPSAGHGLGRPTQVQGAEQGGAAGGSSPVGGDVPDTGVGPAGCGAGSLLSSSSSSDDEAPRGSMQHRRAAGGSSGQCASRGDRGGTSKRGSRGSPENMRALGGSSDEGGWGEEDGRVTKKARPYSMAQVRECGRLGRFSDSVCVTVCVCPCACTCVCVCVCLCVCTTHHTCYCTYICTRKRATHAVEKMHAAVRHAHHTQEHPH